MELAEKIFVELLDKICVIVDLAALDAAHHEIRRNLCLVLAHVSASEQELAVEVGHVNLVEVDYVNVLDARESQVLEELTAKTASTNDKDTRRIILK